MKRKSVLITIALTMCLLAAGFAAACSGTSGGGQGASDQGGAAQGSNKGLEQLAIIHTNDTHGYDQAAEDCLGMAAVAQLKKDYEAKGYEVLLLDAGDVIQGNSLVEDSKGSVAIDFMNAAGYDAMALGNHDFDYYADTTTQLASRAQFPFLAANITVGATGELFVQPNAVFTLENGTKIGVFALNTPETQVGRHGARPLRPAPRPHYGHRVTGLPCGPTPTCCLP